MKKLILLMFVLLSVQTTFSQRRMENLDRGLMAAKVENGVYVNWRITGQEWYGVTYNLYRDGVKLNATPITGASNYVDAAGSLTSTYQVAAVVDGTEQEKCKQVSVLPNPYIEFALHPIPKITGVPDSYYNEYTINDITAADLDGDGEYELLVKRVNAGYDSSKPFENQYYTLFDAYKLDGTFLWRIDMGPNIINSVEINILGYDFDGDGKAEVVLRLSEGSKMLDKDLNVLYEIGDEGNADGDATPDGKTNYRDGFQLNSSWYEYTGPEYLALIDGETCQFLDKVDYIRRKQPGYSNGVYWGQSGQSAGQLAHRACKYFYGAPYLDGKNPSLMISRGIYDKIIVKTYDIQNKKLIERWEWKSENESQPYTGSGNHNYSIADVDGDGCDEIVYGSCTINNDGTGLYTTGLGHGDALHVGDFDPYRKGSEVFACLESSPYHGSTYRAAEDGTILLQYMAGGDTGRCMAANVSNLYKGAEMWPSATGSFSASEMRETTFPSGSWNYRIFWDGDLLDELLDHNWNNSLGKGIGNITKYNDTAKKWETLLTADGYYSCNHSKGTPCLQADLFGDWREEVIWRSADDQKIRIYFTTIPTEHRIYTLMHDMQYRQAIAWQMCGYNQPPHVSYFLGDVEGITLPPPPVMDNQKLVFQPTSNIWEMGSTNWKKDGITTAYTAGSDVLFDASGHVSGGITIRNDINSASKAPRSITVNSPDDYTFDASGDSRLWGSMRMVKQGRGTMRLYGTFDYSGATEIWDGMLDLHGDLYNTPVWINLHAQLAVSKAGSSLSGGVSMNYASVLYPGGKASAGAINILGDLNLKENSILEFDLSNGAADNIGITQGKLNLTEEKAVIRVNKISGDLAVGDYTLISVPNGVEGNLSAVRVEGLGEQVGTLSYQGGNVVLTVENTRAKNTVTWDGSNEGAIWNIFDQQNFTLNAANTYFTTGDNVVFDDTSVSQAVNISEDVTPSSVVVNSANDYTFEGEGKILGTASLTKSGSGRLTLKGTNDITGAVVVDGGTLVVETFPNIVSNGSIGMVSNNPDDFVVNGGIISSTGSGLKVSSRAMRIGENGATINANNAFRWLAPIEGTTLTKTGTGELTVLGANSIDKLILEAGSVKIGISSSSAGKDVVLGNGTTYTHGGTNSTNFEVVEGASARMNLASTATYSGKLTGSGTLTVNIPYVREYLNGDWSAFSGKINFVTDFTHDSWSAGLLFNNTRGLANVDVSVTGKIGVSQNSGGAFTLGGLNATSDVTMSLGNTWTIGGTNTNTTFAGIMSGAGRIAKVGTGAFTLSNANTYTGKTTVSAGYLQVKNTTGSGTGTGEVSVENGGTLSGNGIILSTSSNGINILSGGTVEPGDATASAWSQRIGTLTLGTSGSGKITFGVNSTVKLKVRKRPGYACDKIIFNGPFVTVGNLVVEVGDGSTEFVVGTKLQLFQFNGTVNREFQTVTLPIPPADTEWDTSNLLKTGAIELIAKVGISSPESNVLRIAPNPAEDYISVDLPVEGAARMDIVDLAGATVLSKEITSREQIDVASLPAGVYVVRISIEDKSYISKLVKK